MGRRHPFPGLSPLPHPLCRSRCARGEALQEPFRKTQRPLHRNIYPASLKLDDVPRPNVRSSRPSEAKGPLVFRGVIHTRHLNRNHPCSSATNSVRPDAIPTCLQLSLSSSERDESWEEGSGWPLARSKKSLEDSLPERKTVVKPWCSKS